MTKLLIYREDLKILLKTDGEGSLPSLDSDTPENLGGYTSENLGFSIRSFGQKHADILIAQRVFGNQKEGTGWFGIKRASKSTGLKETDIREWVDNDIDYSTRKQLGLIKKVFAEFKNEAVEIFLWGGWAVDFLAGTVTRPHIDTDTLVWKKDKEKVQKIMSRLGFTTKDKIRKFQNGFEEFQFDNDFVESYGDKFISSVSPQTSGIVWSKETFLEPVEAKLDNIHATVINPKSLYSFLEQKIKSYKRKVGKTSGPVEKTQKDLEVLKKVIGN
ncbi:MAG: hypothetical protein WD231_02605 [Candidatus Woykebacteria bacterium]